jgi:peptidoglycan/LPS O-acetylase OafA/YrhL
MQLRESGMKYMPALDGLRAVAILTVLAFHVFPAQLPGGFTGVDVFFVLSGFLISTLILTGLRERSFTLGGFYWNRIRRLLPNAVLAILVTVLLAHWLSLPSSGVLVARHAVWALFNLSNFFIRRYIGGYWGQAATSAPLVHTWSLAVEEQFYLVFPALLLLLARRRGLLVSLGLAGLASLALCVGLTDTASLVSFYMLPTRAWELLAGALLAAYRTPIGSERPLRTFAASWRLEVLGIAGLALILVGSLWIHDDRGFPGTLALLPALGALGVLVSVVDGASSVARLLATRPMVAIGRVSYSLYLWHWPLITLARNEATLTFRDETTFAIAGALAGVALAVAAYRWVEQPLRQRGPGSGARFAILASGFIVALVVSVLAARVPPLAGPRRFDPVTYLGQLYNLGLSPDARQTGAPLKFMDVRAPAPAKTLASAWEAGGIVHPWGPGPPRVVLLGSSHALMYARTVDEVCRGLGVSVAFLAADGAPVFDDATVNEGFRLPERGRPLYAARRRWCATWKPDVVIAIDRWDAYDDGADGLVRRLRELVGRLSPPAGRVILVTQPPVLRLGDQLNLREYVAWRQKREPALAGLEPDSLDVRRRELAHQIESLALHDARVRVLRGDHGAYEPGGRVRAWCGRTFFYVDDDHLSEAGAERMREPFWREIAEACRPQAIRSDMSSASSSGLR